jgi:hypothetical protein
VAKRHRLLGPDGSTIESSVPGQLGGRRGSTGGRGYRDIYGRLDCPGALRALQRGDTYAQHRVFFADEAAAVAAGFRPCAVCMADAYRAWKEAQRTPSASSTNPNTTNSAAAP